jgi:hypothetical protein
MLAQPASTALGFTGADSGPEGGAEPGSGSGWAGCGVKGVEGACGIGGDTAGGGKRPGGSSMGMFGPGVGSGIVGPGGLTFG